MYSEVPAKAILPSQHSLSAKVKLTYLERVDPWLVHATFELNNATQPVEIERYDLVKHAMMTGGIWSGVHGARLRIGAGERFVRFRLTDQDQTWVDFEVKRKPLEKFILKTLSLCSYEREKAAMADYINKHLGEL